MALEYSTYATVTTTGWQQWWAKAGGRRWVIRTFPGRPWLARAYVYHANAQGEPYGAPLWEGRTWLDAIGWLQGWT